MKAFFLKELSISLKKYSFSCFAWSIMNDHYHLVIKSNKDSISLFMQRLNSIFAKEYNRKNHRDGVVFSKRFSSIVIQEGKNLNDIIRHTHLNPVRRGECTIDNLDNYKWCGHSELINIYNTSDKIVNTKEVLKLFGDSTDGSEYKNFTNSNSDINDSEAIDLVRASNRGSLDFHDSNCFIIGDKDFTHDVLDLDLCRRRRIARYVRENLTLDGMLRKVKNGVDFGIEDFFRQGRLNEISTARQLFATVGHCNYEFSCTDIAKYLNITTAGVSTMISRSKRIIGLPLLKEMICRA
jgi:REP element-mobilizing transposase RayT